MSDAVCVVVCVCVSKTLEVGVCFVFRCLHEPFLVYLPQTNICLGLIRSLFCRYFLGELKSEPKSASEMTADIQKWLTRHNSAASIHDFIEFQADYLAELIQQSGKNDVIPKARDVWHDWARARQVNIGTFRDEIYTSVYTGQKAEAEIAWMKNMDDEDIAPICNGHQKED